MTIPIAIIDDETVHVDYYVAALQGLGLQAEHFTSPDLCLSALRLGNRFSLFVIDLMMPSFGEYSRASMQNYLTTGLHLAKDIRKSDAEIPIVLFTNLNIDSILAEVKAELSGERNIFVVRKIDYPPHIFAEAIGAVLSGQGPFAERSGILRRFWDSLVLEPNVCGLGIDIKKLAK
jgi:CheY-like chemotaxis protein